MKRIIDAGRGLLSEATQIVRGGKALVVACAVGAMIAGAFVVSTPNPALTGSQHSWGDCRTKPGSYYVWMCLITGHYGGGCLYSNGKCGCS